MNMLHFFRVHNFNDDSPLSFFRQKKNRPRQWATTSISMRFPYGTSTAFWTSPVFNHWASHAIPNLDSCTSKVLSRHRDLVYSSHISIICDYQLEVAILVLVVHYQTHRLIPPLRFNLNPSENPRRNGLSWSEFVRIYLPQTGQCRLLGLPP